MTRGSLRRSGSALRRAAGLRGFTLIELLVVVAMVSLLVSILVPSLGRAREQARLVACQSHLHQIGAAVVAYAHPASVIPHGPEVSPLPPMLEGNDGTKSTNQIWTGPQAPAMSLMALGLLIHRGLTIPELLYCPADDSSDPVVELAKVRARRFEPAFCSYLYRQVDDTDGRGRIEALGRNGAGQRASALAMDINYVVTSNPAWARTNHHARRVNVLYLDASVASFRNEAHRFSIRDEDLADLDGRRDRILQTADAGYLGRCP